MTVPFDVFRHSPSLLKNVIFQLLKGTSQIDATFLYSYIPNGQTKSRRFAKGSLSKSFKISNWNEHSKITEEFRDTLLYVTIEDVKMDEVVHYANSLLRKKKNLYIAFYNDSYYLQIDHDELVIIAISNELAGSLKTSFKSFSAME
ncbi:Uncharacterised protein [Lysinibacillus sphaericus]|nr:Uncharacterised protein [Lysinibacillus sphaericus]